MRLARPGGLCCLAILTSALLTGDFAAGRARDQTSLAAPATSISAMTPQVAPSPPFAWEVEGNLASAYLGLWVASAGDVNGDGYDDIYVGSRSTPDRSAVYLGSASGPSLQPASILRFAKRGGKAGDVDGDGYGDVVVSAIDRIQLYRGSPAGLESTPSWDIGPFTIGPYTLDSNVSTAGDVNGDGYSDVVVGEAAYSFGQGRALLYMGSATGLQPAPSWTYLGSGGNLGRSVATAGDVNGDGFDDVIIGAPKTPQGTPTVFLFLGSESGLAASPDWVSPEGSCTPVYEEDDCFSTVSTAGDVNGDGFDDVILSFSKGEVSEFAGASVFTGGPRRSIPIPAVGPAVILIIQPQPDWRGGR